VLCHDVDHCCRVRTVPDQVAQERIAIGTSAGGVFQTRSQRLEVAVDVGEQRDDQTGSPDVVAKIISWTADRACVLIASKWTSLPE
jgi:hypothetical protein